jgi:hypothetical protein
MAQLLISKTSVSNAKFADPLKVFVEVAVDLEQVLSGCWVIQLRQDDRLAILPLEAPVEASSNRPSIHTELGGP